MSVVPEGAGSIDKEVIHECFTHLDGVLGNVNDAIHVVAEMMADAMPVDSSTVYYVNVLDVCNDAITSVDYYNRTW